MNRVWPLSADLAALRMRLALVKLALKYNPDQPRAPAGSHDGGQWVRDAANEFRPLVPDGVHEIPVAHNPLDPKNINAHSMSLSEQQEVANAVNQVNAGLGVRGHNYENRPSSTTGAQLPNSLAGYTTYDVGPKSGARRLIVENATRQFYYTNNRYKSFWAIGIEEGKSAKFWLGRAGGGRA